MYPFEQFPTPDNYRGMLTVNNDLCIGCKICVRDCPAEALECVKIEEKKFRMTIYIDRCVQCAQCVESCPKKCYEMTSKHDLAAYTRESLKVE
jgi:formate hydrogenlyase subunit 6/NADH:ubiquinone oxidoreductase subunit I